MTRPQPTPGPWSAVDEHGTWVIRSQEHGLVAQTGPFAPHANARLIAAAPDLLAACELVFDRLTDGRPSMSRAEMEQSADVLRAAIAAAKGGQG